MRWNQLRSGAAVLFRCCRFDCRKLRLRATLGCSRLPNGKLAASGYFHIYPDTQYRLFELQAECVCPNCGERYRVVVAIKTATVPLIFGLAGHQE